MSAHASAHSIYLMGNGFISGPMLAGGGIGYGFWGDLRKSGASLATNVLQKAKTAVSNAVPVLLEHGKNIAKSALAGVLSSDGSIGDRIKGGLSAGMGSFDKSALQSQLYDSVRPVF